MSASIKYVEIKNNGKCLPVLAPNSFIESIERAFGRFPCELGPQDVLILKGMLAVGGSNSEAYEKLIDYIGEDRVIKIWAEY